MLLRQGLDAVGLPSIVLQCQTLRNRRSATSNKLLHLTDSRPHQTRLQTKPLQAWHICKPASVSALSWNLQESAFWMVADVTGMPDA